jgi:TonB family protein
MVIDDRVKLPVESVRRAGEIPGPPAQLLVYDAPEIASGTIMSASDMWSLGITLVEALTQHPPFWDRSIRHDPVVPVEIGKPFAEIARGCLRYEHSRRMSRRDIKTLLNPSPSLQEPANDIDQAAPTEMEPHLPGHTASSKTHLVAIVAGIVVLVAVIVFALTRSHPTQPMPSAAPPAPPAVTPAAQPAPSPAAPPHSAGSSRGEVAQRVMPDVAASANRTIQGKVDVTVRVDVDAKGAVTNARLESRGPSRYFADKALEAARKWRFKPPRQDGNAAPSAWNLRFLFRRGGPEANAVEVLP